jgi:DNA-directed RNA polymerase specialized sigma24 family protein
MHAPFGTLPESCLHQSWRHRSDGGTQYYFDPLFAEKLINDYNRTSDSQALEDLLRHIEPLAKSILGYRNTVRHEALDELLSRIRVKVWRSLRLYDATRGSTFSFVAKIITSTAASTISENWKHAERFAPFEEAHEARTLFDPVGCNEALTEIEFKVRGLKTACTDPDELEAQKWLVESFLDSGFRLRRWESANAMMQVYGLTHARSRQLFDITMVAIRRELLPARTSSGAALERSPPI